MLHYYYDAKEHRLGEVSRRIEGDTSVTPAFGDVAVRVQADIQDCSGCKPGHMSMRHNPFSPLFPLCQCGIDMFRVW